MDDNDILSQYMTQATNKLTKSKSHHKKDKEHKHKHSKEQKESSTNADPVVTGAQAFVKRGGTNASSSIKPQLEGAYHLTNILHYP